MFTETLTDADTDLQIDLQALMIDFCLKGDEMELLCDNQRGLDKTDDSNHYCSCGSKVRNTLKWQSQRNPFK